MVESCHAAAALAIKHPIGFTVTSRLCLINLHATGVRLLSVLAFVGSATIASGLSTAATMSLDASLTPPVVSFSGRIVDGDYERFRQLTKGVSSARVVLNSPGGLVEDGLQIGNLVRSSGYSTQTPDGAMCASACGFIWLAGKTRTIEGSGKVGFHAAYLGDENQTVSSSGNALVGAYLSRLGFNDFVVVYVTQAAPRDMRWLTPADATFLKLPVSWSGPEDDNNTEPAFTREQIEEALLSEESGRARKRRFPRSFELLVDAVFKLQTSGEDYETAVLRELLSRPEHIKTQERIISEASDEKIVAIVQTEVAILKGLQNTDPQLCAARLYFPGYSIDAKRSVRAWNGKLKPIFDKMGDYARSALIEPPVKVEALTKRQKARLLKRMEKLNAQKRFSKRDLVQLFGDRKKKPNPKLACRWGILTLENFMRDRPLLISLYRYPEVFK